MRRLATIGRLVVDYLAGFLRDPVTHDGSSTRLAGLLCVITGCVIAYHHYTDGATVVGILITSGGIAFLLRKKADGGDV